MARVVERRLVPRVGALLVLLLAPVSCDTLGAELLFRTATRLGTRGEWEAALHYYERLWVQYPDSPYRDMARLRAARIYAGPARNPRSAEELYRTLVAQARETELREQALLELAELYTDQLHDPVRAIAALEAYLQHLPEGRDVPEIRLRLAELYLRRQRLFQAIDEAQPLTHELRRDVRARAWSLIGHAWELLGRREEAFEAYARAISESEVGDETWITAEEGRIRMLEEAGHWREAVAALRRLRSHHPNPDAIEQWLVAIQTRHTEMGR